MSKLIKFITLLLVVLGAVFIFFLLRPQQLLSDEQKQIREMFGSPYQFVITYLPRGGENNPELVRHEVWLYPKQVQKITFSAGKITATENYSPETEIKKTSLKPENFEAMMDYQDVAAILGEENIDFFDMPVFNEQGEIATYASTEALFIIEQGYLTYFQTLQASNGQPTVTEAKTTLAPPSPTEKAYKTYTNSDFGFEIDYPSDWFLSYWVLTTYDPNYLVESGKLPEKRLKCDFHLYNPNDVKITGEGKIIDNEIEVFKGQGAIASGVEGPGLGDGILFLIKDDQHEPISLLCYAYDESFEPELIRMLKTFKFL